MPINKVYIKIKHFLRIIIIILIIIIVFIKLFKIFILKTNIYEKNNFLKIIKDKNNTSFNIKNHIYLENIIFNNKITKINVYSTNDPEIINITNNNKELLNLFGNNINIIDLVVENNNIDDIANLISFSKEDFITKYNINYPIFFVKNNNYTEQYFNKTLIYDEQFSLKKTFDKKNNISSFKNYIINISNDKKILKRIKNTNYDYNNSFEDTNFVGEFKNFIIIEKNNGYDFPIFAILDSLKKQILLTTISGKILNIIKFENICLAKDIKEKNGKIYIIDSCNGEIQILDLNNLTINSFINNKNLIGIDDFEFIDDNNIFFIKNSNIFGIINIIENKCENIFKKDGLEIGNVTNIIKHNNLFYFFDNFYNKLYSFNLKNNSIELLFNINSITQEKIKYFFLHNLNNIYFIANEDNKIYFFDGLNLTEKTFDNFLFFPQNIQFFRNYYYFLSNNFLQKINFLTNEKENIYLIFSAQFKINQNDILKEKIIINNLKKINIKNKLLNLNFLYNNTDYEFVLNSPSFLLLFEIKENNTLSLINNLNILSNNHFEIDLDKNKKYVLYGKIFYNNLLFNEIKIKTIENIISFDENNGENVLNFTF